MIAAHFIDDHMMPQSVVLGVTLIPDMATSDDLNVLLSKVMNDYDIEEEKLHIVANNSPLENAFTIANIKILNGFSEKLEEALDYGMGMLLLLNRNLINRLNNIQHNLRKHDLTKNSHPCSRLRSKPYGKLTEVR
ncbi:unnamed protein product [Strongylus vulgaris]|uniref:Uncharacterized protein n=1 Tax=Strongylus vulgaris TaxID=40348 RepID=A0A3P7J1A1_STRVU|nr:unnamed protein product [Strongylus vulgaris]